MFSVYIILSITEYTFGEYIFSILNAQRRVVIWYWPRTVSYPLWSEKIASWFVSFNTEHVCKHLFGCVRLYMQDYRNNIVKLHVTILFVSWYIYIWLIRQSYTYTSTVEDLIYESFCRIIYRLLISLHMLPYGLDSNVAKLLEPTY